MFFCLPHYTQQPYLATLHPTALPWHSTPSSSTLSLYTQQPYLATLHPTALPWHSTPSSSTLSLYTKQPYLDTLHPTALPVPWHSTPNNSTMALYIQQSYLGTLHPPTTPWHSTPHQQPYLKLWGKLDKLFQRDVCSHDSQQLAFRCLQTKQRTRIHVQVVLGQSVPISLLLIL